MPDVKIDFQAVEVAGISTQATDETWWSDDVFAIPVCIPLAEVGPWLAAYDPTNQYSPSAADSRVIARAVLDALMKAAED
mgnify:FL=1|jgi:hypothetical protein